jgi:hypothetical protein
MIPTVRHTHSDNAKKAGLASLIRSWPIQDNTELRRMGGRRPHTLEESIKRRERPRRPSTRHQSRDSRGRFTTVRQKT